MKTNNIIFLACLTTVALWVTGCSCNGNNEDDNTGDSNPSNGNCKTDQDNDGFGEGCDRGPDCNDSDPRQGGPEVCDEYDNDCDDTVDEGVNELCAECTADCSATSFDGNGGSGWGLNESNSGGGIIEEDGALTLDQATNFTHHLWIANTNEGTVSKLDANTGKELARYPSVMPPSAVPGATWPVYDAGTCTAGDSINNVANCPSRTAMDQNYDAYVANRAFGKQGTVTKIADRLEDCVDRNGTPGIQTSSDLNDNGTIEPGEIVEDDECILWTTAVDAVDSLPRALAVGRKSADAKVGNVWVGTYSGEKVIGLDAEDGSIIAGSTTDVSPLKPYGLATDRLGRLWISTFNSRQVGYVEPFTVQGSGRKFALVPDAPSGIGAYGIAVDGDNHIYLASWNAPNQVARYTQGDPDPADGTWDAFAADNMSSPTAGTRARGVAADQTNLWVAISGGGADNQVLQFRLKTPDEEMHHYKTHIIDSTNARVPVGVGVAANGTIWAVAQEDNVAARLTCSNPTCDCNNTDDCKWDRFPVGAKPYTYSDFTGFGLNVLADPGHFRFAVDPCGGQAVRWQGINYTNEGTDSTGAVKFRVRGAESKEALEELSESEGWFGTFTGNPVDLTTIEEQLGHPAVLQIEIQLFPNDPVNPPRITAVNVGHVCLSGGEQ